MSHNVTNKDFVLVSVELLSVSPLCPKQDAWGTAVSNPVLVHNRVTYSCVVALKTCLSGYELNMITRLKNLTIY